MTSFQYIEFYDVPRTIALRHKGKLFLLQSAFDEKRDDYPSKYTVYRLPESVAEQLASGSWRFLEEVPVEPVGQIPIENVRFDSTKRKELDGSILDEFIR